MDTTSVIRAALRELEVELILAHSPQAKGRVERDFGTSQDRLVKELRVLDISTFDEANRYLQEVYIPFWTERFVVEPAAPRDVHRRLPKRFDLESLFAETLTRTIGNDFTITYKRRRLQIAKSQARGIRPGQKLMIELRLDGSTATAGRTAISTSRSSLRRRPHGANRRPRYPDPHPLRPNPGPITRGRRTARSSRTLEPLLVTGVRLLLRSRRFRLPRSRESLFNPEPWGRTFLNQSTPGLF